MPERLPDPLPAAEPGAPEERHTSEERHASDGRGAHGGRGGASGGQHAPATPGGGPATPGGGPATPGGTEAARLRLAAAQEELLAALVSDGADPAGFDTERLAVQRRALAAKRADVVAAVAPELPGILGADYRTAFLDYAHRRPMRGGYRRDALDFAGHLLALGLPAHPAARRKLTQWWRERAGPTPPPARPAARLARLARTLAGFLPRPGGGRPDGDGPAGDGRSRARDVPEGASRVEYVGRPRSGR